MSIVLELLAMAIRWEPFEPALIGPFQLTAPLVADLASWASYYYFLTFLKQLCKGTKQPGAAASANEVRQLFVSILLFPLVLGGVVIATALFVSFLLPVVALLSMVAMLFWFFLIFRMLVSYMSLLSYTSEGLSRKAPNRTPGVLDILSRYHVGCPLSLTRKGVVRHANSVHPTLVKHRDLSIPSAATT